MHTDLSWQLLQRSTTSCRFLCVCFAFTLSPVEKKKRTIPLISYHWNLICDTCFGPNSALKGLNWMGKAERLIKQQWFGERSVESYIRVIDVEKGNIFHVGKGGSPSYLLFLRNLWVQFIWGRAQLQATFYFNTIDLPIANNQVVNSVNPMPCCVVPVLRWFNAIKIRNYIGAKLE